MKKITSTLMLTLVTLILCCSASYAAENITLNVHPNLVTIGTFYNGTQLTVSGTVPEGTSAVIRILGEPRSKHFKKKGRALGLLWMNLETVELHGVPDVFLIGTDSTSEKDWQKAGLGFSSVQGETDDLIFNEFIKLMKYDGLYQLQEGVVSYKDASNGVRDFEAIINVPSALRKGVYRVELTALRDGQAVDVATHELHAELRGFPELLSIVAYEHSLIYGILAVIIAILAGLVMTVIFKEKGGVH